MDGEECTMFLMMSWKRQVPRGTKCCLENQNYVIRKDWKTLRVNENQLVKDSERKTMRKVSNKFYFSTYS
jgi:hypothetical protein